MSIEVKNLSFSYGSLSVLRHVNVQIQKGEWVGIIGPNGGGKTTLLKILMGFLKGEGLTKVEGKIGYVPQVHQTDRDFPIVVKELVLLGALSKMKWGRVSEEIKKKANEWIEKLGLKEHEEKMFGALSGGLAQRALFARALMADPDVLLLDEPTANIDLSSAKIIFDLLENLKGKKTILLVTHDLKTIVERVDRFLCVQGEVISYFPKEVCEHFALGLYHTPLMGLPLNHFQKVGHAQCAHRE